MFKKITLAACVILSANAFADTNQNATVVTEKINAMMKQDDIPGVAVQLYVDGKPQTFYFGQANLAKKTPVTKDTIFEVGSISKVMTGLLLAQGVDTAKLQLRESVTKYIPSLSDNFDDITMLNLATHTAGLPFNAPKNITTQKQLYDYLTSYSPKVAPDEEWQYSNFSIGLLGEAIESGTHQNLNQLYRANILSPLKMQPIALVVPDRAKRYIAQGYDAKNNPVPLESLGIFPAAYGIKISAQDAARFLAAAIGITGTPEKILYPMRSTQTGYVKVDDMQQGLGWTIHSFKDQTPYELVNEEYQGNRGATDNIEVFEKPIYDGNNLIDKTGSTDGFRAYIAVLPNKNSGIVILTNKSIRSNDIVKAGREILFQLNQIEVKAPVETEKAD